MHKARKASIKHSLILLGLVFFIFLPGAAIGDQYATGMAFDDEGYDQVPLTAKRTRRDYSNLPSAVSLKKYAPVPGNQGRYGTCVAWSSGYHARTIAESIRLDRTNPHASSNHTFSPWHLYALAHKIGGETRITCKEGMSIDLALLALSKFGPVRYPNFPTQCLTDLETYGAEDFKPTMAYKNRIYAYSRLHTTDGNNKIRPVQKSLSEGKPVVFGMLTPRSFHKARGVWQSREGDLEEAIQKRSGHAMVAVGYDEDRYGGAFEILNSWGSQWGNSGYMWIRFADWQKFVKYSYEMIEQPRKASTLAGQLRFVGSDGKEMSAHYTGPYLNHGLVYALDQPYRSGKEFRLHISNHEPAWVYAFGLDATEHVFRIFPHQKNISPYLGYSANNVAIPDEDHYVRLDQTTGEDYFFFLYSRKKLDFEKIMSETGAVSGGQRFKQLLNALGGKAIDSRGIEFEKSKIAFKAPQAFESVVVIVVKFKHI